MPPEPTGVLDIEGASLMRMRFVIRRFYNGSIGFCFMMGAVLIRIRLGERR